MTVVSPGRLIAVVGPSGVGKDSVMTGIAGALPGTHLVRRVITRDPDQGGEDYDAVAVADFRRRAASGAFALHWQAHGLHYGIPRQVLTRLAGGVDCLANLSRKVLLEAADVFPTLLVLNVTARPETLAERLAAR
ncbi:MAG: phosphonate metabolism protein/1,5-bisphosphokinase (PRPP-forming) PhnN, partial [Pseudomonadota bacterium]